MTEDFEDNKRQNRMVQTLQEEVAYLCKAGQLKRSQKIIEDLNAKVAAREEENNALKTQLQRLQLEYAEFKMQAQFDKHRLEEEIEELQQGSTNNDEMVRLRAESETLKESLMQYWKSISKTLNDEFEEILQMGVSCDVNDIMNALLII